MNHSRIQTIHTTNQNPTNILYIMHNAFRINDNHGIERALEFTNAAKKVVLLEPLDENPRNIDFFKAGILGFNEVLSTLFDEVFYSNTVTAKVYTYLSNYDLVIIDMPYLQEGIQRVEQIVKGIDQTKTSIEFVESNVLVPVRETSNKEEYSARTIRPKIWKKVNAFLDLSTNYQNIFHYEQKALFILEDFIENKLVTYDEKNHPDKNYVSGLSKYLKYGFISPLTIYNRLLEIDHPNKDIFLEELIIRRELSYNFIYYNKGYNQFDKMTYEWAYKTMEQHAFDEKEYIYDIEDYITFNTHDPYFNTAMKEMVYFGEMHGYMRMYWAKKIIEWSYTFEDAYRIAIYLNNYYFIDGNTPNGYTGVAWCFGKHDRAWTQRPIFGKLRYMNANGLKRKFDIENYVTIIEQKVRKLDENLSKT